MPICFYKDAAYSKLNSEITRLTGKNGLVTKTALCHTLCAITVYLSSNDEETEEEFVTKMQQSYYFKI